MGGLCYAGDTLDLDRKGDDSKRDRGDGGRRLKVSLGLVVLWCAVMHGVLHVAPSYIDWREKRRG
jgi:hypothetical protein